MEPIDFAWPSEDIDAVSIELVEATLAVTGSDSNQIELTGLPRARAYNQTAAPQQFGRWLIIQTRGADEDSNVTLRLPRGKVWVVDLSMAEGDVKIQDVRLRLTAELGSGDLAIQDCQGVFHVMGGQGDIELDNCSDADVPPRPSYPEGVPGRRPHSTTYRAWLRHEAREGAPRESPYQDWPGDEARAQTSPESPDRGIHVQHGRGDVTARHIETSVCIVRLAHGDVRLEEGRIARLDASTQHGDVTCEGIAPDGDWTLATRHGDLHLSLPADAQARLDVATRHGDIDSDIPLVRVGRPGPEARYGGRMVGSVGDGPASQISLTTVRGDINVELGDAPARPPRQPQAAPPAPGQPPAPVTPEQPAERSPAPLSAPPNAPPTDVTGDSGMPAGGATMLHESQMAVLQALSDGNISPEEAEKLLRSLE